MDLISESKPARRPFSVIEPTRGLGSLNLRELWSYRDLLWMLAERDIRLRYKQTALGVVWVILQPLVSALIFAAVFGVFAKLPSDGQPYLLFVFTGMLAWNFFSGSLQRSGNSLVGNSQLISKVYFPRILIPLSSILAVFIDFLVSFAVLIVLMLAYQVAPTWRMLTLPVFVLLAFLAAVGAGLWLTALNVYYRDFMYTIPFIIQAWTYASPVAYSTSIVPEQWRFLYSLNPTVGFIEGFRWALLGQSTLDGVAIVSSVAISLLLSISGVWLFRRVERGFADVI